MTRLQALELCRDAVRLTRGVSAGIWFEGQDKHCTVGAVQQVAMDCGFPRSVGEAMLGRLRVEIPDATLRAIVNETDEDLNMTPSQRQAKVLGWLDEQIAKEQGEVVVPDSPAGIGEVAGVDPECLVRVR